LKSQRYRISENKFWRIYRQRFAYKYYKRGVKSGERTVPSGYFESQTWGALHKCWIGFVIAKEKMEWDKIEIYARRIQHLQKDLGIEKISKLQKVLIVVIFIIIIGWGIHFVIHFLNTIEKNSIINSLIYSQVSSFLMFLFI
jgi:hypothetical protein